MLRIVLLAHTHFTSNIAHDHPQAIVDAEWDILYSKLQALVDAGVKVVLSKLPIGDVATQFFADRYDTKWTVIADEIILSNRITFIFVYLPYSR